MDLELEFLADKLLQFIDPSRNSKNFLRCTNIIFYFFQCTWCYDFGSKTWDDEHLMALSLIIPSTDIKPSRAIFDMKNC